MPKRSRGFWICDYCELTFDYFDEARTHEIQACTSVLRPSNPRSPSQSFPTMAPLSRRDETMGNFDQQDSQQEQQQLPQPLSYNPPPPVQQRTPWARPLMDASDPDTFLSEADATACRSLELFHVSAASDGDDTVVGVRCLYCRGGASAFAEQMPRSVDAVGDSVRLLIEQHLLSCTTQDVRNILERAIRIREDGESTDEEEESYKRALSEFCVSKCHSLGIIDCKPPKTGIMVQDPSALSWTAEKSSETQEEIWDDTATASRNDLAPGNESLEPMPLNSLPDPPAPQQHPQQQPYGAPLPFPFFQAPNGDWMCRYCCHLPPEYRDQHFIWSTPNKTPPTSHFVDHHMSICREFNRMNYQYYQPGQQMMLGGPYVYPADTYAPPVWDGTGSQEYMHPPASSTGQFLTDNYSRMIPRDAPFDRREALSSRQRRSGRREGASVARLESNTLDPLSAIPREQVDKNENDETTEQSISHLMKVDQSIYDNEGNLLPEEAILVVEDDRLLLTDYFFYLMKQLRLVRFSEKDRRTRGGKRENIQVGYGGLQCVHCSKESNARKFFWSNVDRLANSFAEIPGHILKCRHCPEATKQALLQLKQLHPEQMARLPRGSQKVFFRRMWHRLHDKDPPATPSDAASSVGGESSASTREKQSPQSPVDAKLPTADSPSRTGSEESIVMFEKPSIEAAKALADAAMQASPPSPSSRVLLAIPEDKEWLSDTDCFVRRQIEVFCATKEDSLAAEREGMIGTQEGQVGIRCLHCALAGTVRTNAVAYPFAISGIYEAVREFHRAHLETCSTLPLSARAKLESLKGCSSLSSVLRKYYILSAQALGLHDTKDGIKAGAKPIPVGTQTTAFAFAESSVTKEMKSSLSIGDTFSDLSQEDDSSRKRKSIEGFTPGAKRSSPSPGMSE